MALVAWCATAWGVAATSAAASACCPASTKNAAANEYLCLDMSAYAFFSAASLCRSSEKFLDKNSASLVSRDALKSPARTLVLPRAAYSSAQGFSPPGSRVAANSARAAASRGWPRLSETCCCRYNAITMEACGRTSAKDGVHVQQAYLPLLRSVLAATGGASHGTT